MYQTTNISFACRPSKESKRTGLAPVELVINMNGKRTYLTLPMKMSAAQFDKDMKSTRNNATKEFCDATRTRVNNMITELMKYGMNVNTDTIKEAYLNGVNHNYTVADLFNEYLKILYTKSATSVSAYKKYEYARDLFLSVVKNKQASELTNADILMYQAEVEKRFKASTAAGYMTRLKTFITFGLNNNKFKTNPFYGIKIKKPKTTVETISEEEYNKIKNKEIKISRLARVRDFTILQCNCGLSFADLAQLTPDDFMMVNDMIYINKARVKTKVKYCSVILPDGVEILEKYNFDIKNMLLSNQKMNAYLKEIADICGITVNLHTHAFRHYYATKLVRSGVSLALVQKAMGHSNIKTTINTYSHLMNEDVVDGIKKQIC